MNAFGLSKLYKELKAQREKFKAFLDGFDTFDDKEFLLRLQEFYSWDAEKLLIEYNSNVKIKNKKKVVVKTNDYYPFLNQEGSGRDFSYWTEWYPRNYEILCDKPFKFEKRIYTKQELSELCKQDKIIVLNRNKIDFSNEVDADIASTAVKELSKVPLNKYELPLCFQNRGMLSKKEIDDVYKDNSRILKIIRKDISKEQAKQDYILLCDETRKYQTQILSKLKAIKDRKNKFEETEFDELY